MTIAELARSVGRTHSALSQKVAAMRAAGWLETTPGRDARSKKVTLTPKAERVAALLAAGVARHREPRSPSWRRSSRIR